nr:hypothetical protein [Tanacetum cinerariifolium]
MFIQLHDPDYVPEPVYPEYIPLKDEHVLLAEEQPLPPVVSPTAESLGYVVESDPEEYEDDESEDGPVDYRINGGDDGDDDDGDPSGDDANDEEDEEEEDYLASNDSAIVVPTIEPVSPPEGTEPVIPLPSTDITTTGGRITAQLQASISLPPEAEVERLLAMPTPPPSPLTLLSPPSTGKRLARCMAPYAHSSPPPIPSLLLPSSGCPTQIQTLRIASTPALIDAVIAVLPSPPLPPLPHLYTYHRLLSVWMIFLRPSCHLARTVMSSSDSTVTYTSVSSEDVPLWGIRFFGMEQPNSPKAAPQSPIQTPLVHRTRMSDEETEDGLVDYPMDGGDDGDDDDSDSSGDEANDEEEDEEEEEEEHLALTDSAIVHGPSCMLASTQALIDAVTAVIASPPLPPPLYIPPPVDRKDDVLEIEMPPHKRLCLSTLGSRYEVEESFTARPTRDRGINYGFVSTLDAEARR